MKHSEGTNALCCKYVGSVALFLIATSSMGSAGIITRASAGIDVLSPTEFADCDFQNSGTPNGGSSSTCLVTGGLVNYYGGSIIGTGTVSANATASVSGLYAYVAASALASNTDHGYDGGAGGFVGIQYSEPLIFTTSATVRYIDLVATFHASTQASNDGFFNVYTDSLWSGVVSSTNVPGAVCNVGGSAGANVPGPSGDTTQVCRITNAPFSAATPFSFYIGLQAQALAFVTSYEGSKVAVAAADASHTVSFQLTPLDVNYQPVIDAQLVGSDGTIYPNASATPEPTSFFMSGIALCLVGMLMRKTKGRNVA